VQALEPRAIEDALAGGQARQVDPRSEVAHLQCGRSDDAPHILERGGRRILHDEARRAIGPAPHNRAIAVDVARRHAEGGRRPFAFGSDDGGRLARERRAARTQAGP
jgi:hypothetical protein